MPRFTRLTNAFSKKLDNHIAAIAIHLAYYNFVRIHQTLASLLRWLLASLIGCGR
jgi:hypothetical protein